RRGGKFLQAPCYKIVCSDPADTIISESASLKVGLALRHELRSSSSAWSLPHPYLLADALNQPPSAAFPSSLPPSLPSSLPPDAPLSEAAVAHFVACVLYLWRRSRAHDLMDAEATGHGQRASLPLSPSSSSASASSSTADHGFFSEGEGEGEGGKASRATSSEPVPAGSEEEEEEEEEEEDEEEMMRMGSYHYHKQRHRPGGRRNSFYSAPGHSLPADVKPSVASNDGSSIFTFVPSLDCASQASGFEKSKPAAAASCSSWEG
ncbi:hypothetical protein NSK_002947, partial [Nannochloropsis salina CCMP1776]